MTDQFIKEALATDFDISPNDIEVKAKKDNYAIVQTNDDDCLVLAVFQNDVIKSTHQLTNDGRISIDMELIAETQMNAYESVQSFGELVESLSEMHKALEYLENQLLAKE